MSAHDTLIDFQAASLYTNLSDEHPDVKVKSELVADVWLDKLGLVEECPGDMDAFNRIRNLVRAAATTYVVESDRAQFAQELGL